MAQTLETETGWLLKDPGVALTTGERDWFDWAVSGAQDVLTDEDWLADNDDALTIEGQLLDLRYRLEGQAPDVAQTDATSEQLRVRMRSLKSLLQKLEASSYWDEGFHK